MPDQKISVDPAAADLSGCIIPVVTGGINKQAANSLFGITGVANGVIYSAGNRNTSDPTNFNYVPGTQTLTVVGPIRTSPVTNEATVATPANGMIIYSTALSKFRAYENGAWVNLIGGAGGGWPFTGTGTFTGAVTIDQTTTAGNILKFLTPNLGVTSINGKGIWIQNATAAAAGAQQISGGVLWEGQGWATTPVQTQPLQYMADLLPVQGAANPTGIWRLRSSINGAAYVKVVDFNGTSNGVTMQLYDNGSNVSTLSTQYFGFGTGFAIIQNAGTFPMYIGNDGTGSVNIRVNASNRWSFGNAATSYSISPGADNTYDIGAQGANIPRNIYSYKSHIGGSSTPAASLEITQAILSASWQPALRIDPGAHTSMTAATEFKDYNFTTRTATWLAGTTATQRFAHFQGQTVAGASASATFTDLYTVYIDPSIQGSQAIITNNWALGLGGGLKLFVGTTTRPALVLPAGINLSTTQAGALENDGTHLYFTFANAGTRYQLDQQGSGSPLFNSLLAATNTNTIDNTNFIQTWKWDTLGANIGLKLSSASTAAASNTQLLFQASLTGVNSNSNQTTYAGQFANTHTGTGSVNVALLLGSQSGAFNYALIVPDASGFVGIGNVAPARLFHATINDATTTGTIYPFRITRTSTGTPALGIGVGMEFEVEASNGVNVVGGQINSIVSAATVGSETIDLQVLNYYSGSVNTAFYAKGKAVHVGGDATVITGLANTNLGVYGLESSTNTVINQLALMRYTSGTPGIGVGTGIAFYAQTTAGGNPAVGSRIYDITTAVGTAGSEKHDLVFETNSLGSVTEKFRIESTGQVSMVAKIAVTPATTGTMTTTLTNLTVITITPTGACTFNASGGTSGQDCSFVITTSGASSFVLTWGTNFKTIGTLATGTVTAKVFTVNFVYDGTNWNEKSRTTAM